MERMELETYLIGVVAAETPVSFEMEALKAQAVAARTYTLYHARHGGCRANEGAYVCTDSACCQAYLSDARMRERWQKSYRANRKRVETAVQETAYEVLTYDSEPIETLYHSASGGHTENVEDVYAEQRAYLRGVPSTAEVGSARPSGQKAFTRQAFCTLVNEKWSSAALSPGRLEEQVEILSLTGGGRVKSVRLGNTAATGRAIRSLLGLDSTLFSVALNENEIQFFTKGYGHGVGMSQSGAQAMALGGRSYEEILLYYYTGVSLSKLTLS